MLGWCPTTRAAAFFDLDKTILAKSSSLAFARPFYQGGLIGRADVVRSAYAQFVYLVSGADHDQMEQMRAVHVGAVQGLGRRPGPQHRGRDARLDRRADRVRGGGPRSSRSTGPQAATSW